MKLTYIKLLLMEKIYNKNRYNLTLDSIKMLNIINIKQN